MVKMRNKDKLDFINQIVEETKKQSFNSWIKLRDDNKDGWNEKLCYCGHTTKCSCANPDMQTFKDSVKRGSIILGDNNNGWKTIDGE